MDRLFGDKICKFLAEHTYVYFKSTVDAGGCAIYQYLIRTGVIQRDEEQIRRNVRRAREELFAIGITKEASVTLYAQALCVDDYFNQLRAQGIEKLTL